MIVVPVYKSNGPSTVTLTTIGRPGKGVKNTAKSPGARTCQDSTATCEPGTSAMGVLLEAVAT
jgi:hypothetical protein